ncbi:hypothetical protein CROQUDRAFT_667337 [Cronartium quercuum f. sp. fusiforme G11]|uniref:Uncharacterized protein n=1 Tax=Cronartium quercuum f. sp. fusiforme G11 TaxID=708437 RepID=A0A9P6THH0_9BASI|nr:hypothetical protein CROQUDRAFT_667337 [Cronartium quercuum f. sp. fusiforme G11]
MRHMRTISLLLVAFTTLIFTLSARPTSTEGGDPHVSAKFQTINYHETSHQIGPKFTTHDPHALARMRSPHRGSDES